VGIAAGLGAAGAVLGQRWGRQRSRAPQGSPAKSESM
jgi:hypothetical protein